MNRIYRIKNGLNLLLSNPVHPVNPVNLPFMRCVVNHDTVTDDKWMEIDT